MNSTKMQIQALLNNNRCVDDTPSTHLSYGSFNGKFHLNKENRKQFMKLYIKAIEEGVNDISILERQQEYAPILIDIDINKPIEEYVEGSRLYSDEMIDAVRLAFEQIFTQAFQIKKNKIMYFLQEKPKPTFKKDKLDNTIVKDGFHIIVPEICASADVRHKVRNEAVKILQNSQVFTGLNVDKIIDKDVVSKNGWFLYGSVKPDTLMGYSVTKYYSKSWKTSEFSNEELIKYLSLQSSSYSSEKATTLNEAFVEIMNLKDSISENNVQPHKPHYNNDKNDNNYSKIVKNVQNFSDDRACDYDKWSKVGLALSHELGEEGRDMWHEFSKRCPAKYNKHECDKVYDGFLKSKCSHPLTIASIMMWSKEDNFENYVKLNVRPTQKYDFYLNKFTTGEIADLFKTLYGEKFIYSNEKLYSFNGVYWEKDETKKYVSLQNFVDKVFFDFLIQELMKLRTQIIKEKKEFDKEDFQQTLAKINKYEESIDKFREISRRSKIVEDILNKISDNNIKWDDKPYLFAFNNKIFDLQQNKFIQPNPMDYISLTTGYNYDDRYDEKYEIELDKIVNTILHPEIKDFYLTILATGMIGQNLERFVVNCGSGGNGKGLLNDLAMEMFGNYGYVLANQVLLSPLKEGPNPAVANMNNKRFVICREPKSTLKLDVSVMKEITGGDKINARLCNANNTDTNLKLTLVMECNRKPEFSEVDKAVQRRLVCIKYKSEFVDKEIYDSMDDEQKMNTYPINTYYKTSEFKQKYKQALFNVLIKHGFKFINQNNCQLSIPSEVVENSKSYLAGSDELYQYILEYFEPTNDKSSIKICNLWNTFKVSEEYKDLSKDAKRKYNKKTFVEILQSNIFLKNNITTDKSGVLILKGFKPVNADNLPNDLDAPYV